MLAPVVQVPPRALLRQSSRVTLAAAETWLEQTLDGEPSLDELVLRYLGAFGPASVADVATWSRLTGLRPVLERLRPELVTFRDERGRELFDLPDAPRPDAEAPAPVRFLPEYDNLLLSHAHRSRVVSDETRTRLSRGGGVGWGSVLVDGFASAVWRLERGSLIVRHVALSKRRRSSVAAEGRRLLRFLGGRAGDVRLTPL